MTLGKKLNKIRWLVLSGVFCALILLPLFQVYQNHTLAHSHEKLPQPQKTFYDTFHAMMSWFSDDPVKTLDHVKGGPWSATVYGVSVSDPLAVAAQSAAAGRINWTFALSALIPLLATIVLGRFFCGWICPAALVFELSDNAAALLARAGLRVKSKQLPVYSRYLVLALGLTLSAATGTVLMAAVYPPAIISREVYTAIALGGFTIGIWFMLAAILFDFMVSRRGFCRYLCPGGAIYTLLGKFRLLRIQRLTENCNDCRKCHGICQYELNPMEDRFGMECNQCCACLQVCDSNALRFQWRAFDRAYQGPGTLGRTAIRATPVDAETLGQNITYCHSAASRLDLSLPQTPGQSRVSGGK